MDSDLVPRNETAFENPGDRAYRQARQRAEAIQGLYIHLVVYAVINAGLFAINWVTGEGSWWFQWPLLIWGIALVIHLVATVSPVFSPDWVERRAEQMAARRGD